MRRVRLTLRGKVQGTNLRTETARYAEGQGIAGWIRNDARGTVTLEAEAEEPVIAELLQWLQHGPQYAKVQEVSLAELAPTGDKGFRIVQWWHNLA